MASKSEGESLESWLNQKCPGVWICTVCGGQTWQSNDKVFELRESAGGDVEMGGPVYPVIRRLGTPAITRSSSHINRFARREWSVAQYSRKRTTSVSDVIRFSTA